MTGTIGIVTFVVAILLIILVHEAAHFVVAKRFGIKVEEFFLGFGPKLWSTRRGETEYGVKALPLGGYVRIAGMNPFQEPTPEELPRTFGAKPIWQRALVIFAGPGTHYVLAFLFFALWLGLVGQPTNVSPLIEEVEATLEGQPSPAAVAGIRPGDRIVGVDAIDEPTNDQLVEHTRDHVGEPIEIRLLRDGETIEVTVTPVLATVQGERVGRIGVTLGQAREPVGFVESITRGGELVGETTSLVVQSLGRIFGPEGIGRIGDLLFGGAERQVDDPIGIVGAARTAGQAAASGNFGDVLLLFASLNVFVGILNLLPLPPFDGGHLAVLAVEKVRRRKVDLRRLIPISLVVASFLIVYMMAITFLDITKPLPNLFR
ncbi:MAG: RIP metalloprotease [Actinobacteria bacterium]|nr:RIP metalloprotease [Actinomycetota bacterium]